MDLKSLTARLKRAISIDDELGVQPDREDADRTRGFEAEVHEEVPPESGVLTCEKAIEELVLSLKAAVKIEFFTIPPYLTAWWSISDSGHDAAEMVRGIAIEEMIHFGLAANMLVAVTEESIDLKDFVPTYPSEAPANARPGAEVNLRRFDETQAKTFANIEAFDAGGDVDTIGEFYAALQGRFNDLFDRCSLPLSTERQVSYGNELFKVTNRDDVTRAIDLIRRQGEGHPSHGNPYEDPNKPELGFAHFFQFEQYAKGQKYVMNDNGEWHYDPNQPVERAAVIAIADHPAGGYNLETLPEDVREKFEQFDAAFTTVIETMTSAWERGDSETFGNSVIQMYGLTSGAADIMETPIEDSPEFYAPHFRVT